MSLHRTSERGIPLSLEVSPPARSASAFKIQRFTGRSARVLWGALVALLVVGLTIYWSKRPASDGVDIRTTTYLLKCTSASCGQVQTWTGQRILEERARVRQADLAAGGRGYPQIDLKCPLCGRELKGALRTASGQVEIAGAPSSGTTPVSPARKQR